MKLRKGLFMLCAGLSLCACSSDDGNQFPEGKGAVTVKIVPPAARALTTGNAVNGELVHGNITLSLTHAGNQNKETKTLYYNTNTKKYYYDDTYTQECTDLSVVFYNVVTPSLLEASMNGGLQSYNTIAINSSTPNMQATPSEIPVYGSTDDFTLTGNKVNDYLEYSATVALKIPVARVEVNIKGGDLSNFGSVTVVGAYLDHYKPNDETAPTNYYHPNDNNTSVRQGTGASVLSDNSDIVLEQNGYAPANITVNEESKKQYFAYNFYATKEGGIPVSNPKFKLLLTVEKKVDGPVIPTTQYAIIENFVSKSNPSTPINFVNGQIYRIDELVLNGNSTTNNIQVDEEGSTVTYALTAVVSQASWGLVTDVTGSWKQ